MPKQSRNPKRQKNTSRKISRRYHPEAELHVSIGLSSQRAARAIFAALGPDVKPKAAFRSKTSIRVRGRILHVGIVADDLVSLRASANSVLGLVAAASRALEVVRPFYSEIPPPPSRG